ncbi:MAG: site-specific DNA-methyltransferase [Chloroflexi bacterium]|nr:site-specific DNA-methyltransferase [Chloroflexota bacterium]
MTRKPPLSRGLGDAPSREGPPISTVWIETSHGRAFWADSAILMAAFERASIDLIVTSPPFGLVRKKEYGNADADQYVEWFKPFANEFRRILRPTGSLVIDIGGAWIPGQPTKSLYQYELLITLCKEFGFHLAQEFFWWNPSRLPTPAEWVNIRRIRVKDAVNTIFWLSRTPWPKASNRRVLTPYSESMRTLLVNGYRAKKRPSGHDISTKFNVDNGAAIPPNLIAVANTESNSRYLKYCEEHNLPPHPARFPASIPEFFIRFLTDPRDIVFDPFAGSCITGEVAERLDRRWICAEIRDEYLSGARGRFLDAPTANVRKTQISDDDFYKIARPGILWNGVLEPALPSDGGRARPLFTPGRSPKSKLV